MKFLPRVYWHLCATIWILTKIISFTVSGGLRLLFRNQWNISFYYSISTALPKSAQRMKHVPSIHSIPSSLTNQSEFLPHFFYAIYSTFSFPSPLSHWSLLYIRHRNLRVNLSVTEHVPICNAGSYSPSGSVGFNPAEGKTRASRGQGKAGNKRSDPGNVSEIPGSFLTGAVAITEVSTTRPQPSVTHGNRC